MTARPIAYLLMSALPLAGSSVNDRLSALEREVSELQSLVHSLKQREVTPEIPSPAPAKASATHQVRSGESYWSISRRHGVSVSELERANPGVNPRRLAIGSIIRIPGQKNSTPPDQLNTASGTYTVRPGDILGRISENHGIRLHQLLAANPGINPRRLKIGTILNIPGQNSRPAPVAAPTTPKPDQDEGTPTPAPKTVASYQPAPPPEKNSIPKPAPPDVALAKAVDIPKTILVTVDKDMRLAELANQHATSVAILNQLNEVNLSPEQMIKTGSQLYVPGR